MTINRDTGISSNINYVFESLLKIKNEQNNQTCDKLKKLSEVPTIFLLDECLSTINESYERERGRKVQLRIEHDETIAAKVACDEHDDFNAKSIQQDYFSQSEQDRYQKGQTFQKEIREHAILHDNCNDKDRESIARAVEYRLQRQKENKRMRHKKSHDSSGTVNCDVGECSSKNMIEKSMQKGNVLKECQEETNKQIVESNHMHYSLNLKQNKSSEIRSTCVDEIAMKCFQTFVEEMKEWNSKNYILGDNQKLDKDTFISYLKEKYIVQSLSKLAGTKTVLKIKEKVLECIDKIHAIYAGSKQKKRKAHESHIKAKQGDIALVRREDERIQEETSRKLTWDCLICGKKNFLFDTTKCKVCGRMKGFKSTEEGKEEITTEHASEPMKDKVENEKYSHEKVDSHENNIKENEKDKLKLNSKTNISLFLKQKVDYEIESRQELSKDINNIIDSIRSTTKSK